MLSKWTVAGQASLKSERIRALAAGFVFVEARARPFWKMTGLYKLKLGVLAALLCPAASQAEDWPQFLGPHRNGIYDGTNVANAGPSNGPPVVWQVPIGHGFAGPVVAEHKVILFHRLGDKDVVSCLDFRTGSALWTFRYPTTYQDNFGFDDGPRATPCVAAGRIYTFSAQGKFHCLELGTGKMLWTTDLKTEFPFDLGFFGIACSPMVESGVVLVNIGGIKASGIVGLNPNNGKVLWKASEEEASYSSPVAATIHGRRYALFLTRNGLVVLDPAAGKIRFQYAWHSRNRMSVNAATPLVIGDNVFLSACYGTGAVLLHFGENNLEKLWSEDDLLSNHYATSVECDGFLYGIHGRTDPGFSPRPKLRCIDLKTRKVCWETDSIGAASITRAGGRLLILTEPGELVEVAATPQRFEQRARARIFSSEVRAFPAIADGLFYARSKDRLLCLDLGKAE